MLKQLRMEIPLWFFDEENEEDTIDELSKLDIDDDFGFLASSERTQCQFVNTIGMRCPERYWGRSLCCENHKCTYMLRKAKQCTNTVDCNSKWYCTKHSKRCMCQFYENDKRCHDMVYFHIYKTGCNYCFKHQCSSHGCGYPTGNNEYKLCTFHYDTLIFCGYVGNDGNQCTTVVDRIEINPGCKCAEKDTTNAHNCNIISPEIKDSPQQILTNKQPLYCPKHTCHVENCYYPIRNNTTPWCQLHSVQCDFVCSIESSSEDASLFWDMPTNSQCQEPVFDPFINSNENRCKNYVLLPNPDDKDVGVKNPIFCREHKCHWEGNCSDWKNTCHKSSVKKDGCSLYCEEHYQIYKFYKFEYVT